jgi:transcriptional regulator with XRE-family HTH domain
MGDDLPSQLRRRRKELGLLQREAAQAMGACMQALLNWEKGYSTPHVRFYPAIIAFLGRAAWPEPQTLGAQLRTARIRQGLTMEEFADFTGLGRDEVGPIEREEVELGDRALRLVRQFLEA